MSIRLTAIQLRYLLKECALPAELAAALRRSEQQDGVLTLTTSQRKELGEIVAERLQIKGFDRDYSPTSEGKLLESILDIVAAA